MPYEPEKLSRIGEEILARLNELGETIFTITRRRKMRPAVLYDIIDDHHSVGEAEAQELAMMLGKTPGYWKHLYAHPLAGP